MTSRCDLLTIIQRAHGERHRRRAALHTELGVDLLEMLVHGAVADLEDLPDIAVRFAARQPEQDFGLPARQFHASMQPVQILVLVQRHQAEQMLIRSQRADQGEFHAGPLPGFGGSGDDGFRDRFAARHMRL